MLEALRNASKGLTAKILLGLLIASFAVWGVSGAFLGRANDAVVTAGETVVTGNAYRLAYSRTLNDLSQRFGTRLTPEQAAALGVERAVLGDVVTAAVLDEQARELALGITDDELAEAVASETAFGSGGRFDRDQLRRVLRSIGMTEAEYLEEREAVARRQQLLNAVAANAEVPTAFVEASAALDAQARDVSYLRLTRAALPAATTPTEAEIASFFEENAGDYDRPEYRTIRTVALDAGTIADPAGVAPEDVRAEYDANLARYTEPATADVQQLLFPDEDAAAAASARLAEGSVTFDDLIAELGANADAITVRDATLATYPDRTVAEAAFALGEGETSAVEDGRFGPVILRAANVRPAATRPYEEVEGEIRADLAAREASNAVFDVSDALEDARADGETLEASARAQGLEPVTLGPLDAQGLDPDGAPVDLPVGADVLTPAFETEIGVETDSIEAAGGGFVWYEVLDIDPERARTLDEARSRVVEDLSDARAAADLATLARELEEELRRGADFAAIAARAGAPVSQAFAVRRTGGDGLSAAEAEAAFSGPEGHVALVPSGDGYTLLRVDAVTTDAAPAPIETPSAEEDLLQQFVTDLEQRYRPTYDAALAERVRSAGL